MGEKRGEGGYIGGRGNVYGVSVGVTLLLYRKVPRSLEQISPK